MRVLMTGSSGLIGSALQPALEDRGDELWRLVRRPPSSSREIFWDPAAGRLDPLALEGFDAVVHLAGESIGAGRWSAARKARIRDSRVLGTRLLCGVLARLDRPPGVIASASGMGFYGDRGDEPLSESSPKGLGFLADLGEQWESAAEPARGRGIRVVHCRTGLVLSPRGGVLARLLPVYRLGLGGPIGDGRAWWSWIALEDVVGVYRFALEAQALHGPINAVAPGAVTQAEFNRTLGRVLRRPTPFRVPAWALRLAFGEMADEALLASTRVVPDRLRAAGYAFRLTELEGALRRVLRRPGPVARGA